MLMGQKQADQADQVANEYEHNEASQDAASKARLAKEKPSWLLELIVRINAFIDRPPFCC